MNYEQFNEIAKYKYVGPASNTNNFIRVYCSGICHILDQHTLDCDKGLLQGYDNDKVIVIAASAIDIIIFNKTYFKKDNK